MDYIKVTSMGSYYVGGKKVTISGGEPFYAKLVDGWAEPKAYSPDGDYQAGQMYVKYTRIADPVVPYPVCMIHGGGLTGAMWEQTLDGRPGWEYHFLKNGYHVNVSDGVERGRASWAKYPEINKEPPFFRSYDEAWQTFRLGEKYPVPYEGLRFDLSRFDDFMKQQVPRFPAAVKMAEEAYEVYFTHMASEGGYIVFAHSQGGLFALRAALKHPENIKAIILIESTSTMDVSQTDITALKDIPVLHMWADYIDDNYANENYAWAGRYAFTDTMRRFHEKMLELGGDSTWMYLPDMGIKHNSHAPMVEDNSDEIADLVIGWMKEHIH